VVRYAAWRQRVATRHNVTTATYAIEWRQRGITRLWFSQRDYNEATAASTWRNAASCNCFRMLRPGTAYNGAAKTWHYGNVPQNGALDIIHKFRFRLFIYYYQVTLQMSEDFLALWYPHTYTLSLPPPPCTWKYTIRYVIKLYTNTTLNHSHRPAHFKTHTPLDIKVQFADSLLISGTWPNKSLKYIHIR